MAKFFGINFKGFDEMAEKLTKMDGNIKHAVTRCLEAIPPIINPRLESDMQKHNDSGDTLESLEKNANVVWSGTVGKIDVGFHITKGGLPSIFLMYGTAKHAPANQFGKYSNKQQRGVTKDQKLYDDFYGTGVRRQIYEKQRQIMAEEIKKQMGG